MKQAVASWSLLRRGDVAQVMTGAASGMSNEGGAAGDGAEPSPARWKKKRKKESSSRESVKARIKGILCGDADSGAQHERMKILSLVNDRQNYDETPTKMQQPTKEEDAPKKKYKVGKHSRRNVADSRAFFFEKVLPALCYYYDSYKDLKIAVRYVIPDEPDVPPAIRGFKAGRLLHRIKHRGYYVHKPEFLKSMRGVGGNKVWEEAMKKSTPTEPTSKRP